MVGLVEGGKNEKMKWEKAIQIFLKYRKVIFKATKIGFYDYILNIQNRTFPFLSLKKVYGH